MSVATYLLRRSFGSAVVTGDFNGDGRMDLVVGMPGDDGAAGAIKVTYFFSGDSITTSWSQADTGVAGGPEPGDRFVASLASGDFNGDGYDDLVVGSPGEGIGAAADAGAMWVFYGAADGLSGLRSELFDQGTDGVPGGPELGDRFGAAVASGDFNQDGYDDLAVGSPDEGIGQAEDAGAVFVFYGDTDGLSGLRSELFDQGTDGVPGGPELGDRFGAAVASGDFNQDGYDDLAVGSPDEGIGQAEDAGAVFVFYGDTDGLSGLRSELWDHSTVGVGTPETGDRFGKSLGSGDFNGDGYVDLVAGAPESKSEGSIMLERLLSCTAAQAACRGPAAKPGIKQM